MRDDEREEHHIHIHLEKVDITIHNPELVVIDKKLDLVLDIVRRIGLDPVGAAALRNLAGELKGPTDALKTALETPTATPTP